MGACLAAGNSLLRLPRGVSTVLNLAFALIGLSLYSPDETMHRVDLFAGARADGYVMNPEKQEVSRCRWVRSQL